MKFIKNTFILLITLSLLFSHVLSKSLKKKIKHRNHKDVHIVHDRNGFNAELQHVVRRSPTVATETRFGVNRLSAPSNSIYMSNSNTSTMPNIGSFGSTPEIVRNFIFKFRTSYSLTF